MDKIKATVNDMSIGNQKGHDSHRSKRVKDNNTSLTAPNSGNNSPLRFGSTNFENRIQRIENVLDSIQLKDV